MFTMNGIIKEVNLQCCLHQFLINLHQKLYLENVQSDLSETKQKSFSSQKIVQLKNSFRKIIYLKQH